MHNYDVIVLDIGSSECDSEVKARGLKLQKCFNSPGILIRAVRLV